jgi:hypothetical protein
MRCKLKMWSCVMELFFRGLFTKTKPSEIVSTSRLARSAKAGTSCPSSTARCGSPHYQQEVDHDHLHYWRPRRGLWLEGYPDPSGEFVFGIGYGIFQRGAEGSGRHSPRSWERIEQPSRESNGRKGGDNDARSKPASCRIAHRRGDLRSARSMRVGGGGWSTGRLDVGEQIENLIL